MIMPSINKFLGQPHRLPMLPQKTDKSMRPFSFQPLIAAAGMAILIAGCATQPKNAGPKYVFFPPPPDAPPLKFLTAFSSEKDLRGGRAGSFMTFVTGAAPADKPIAKPYGAALSQNKIYVCDTGSHAVLKLDLESRHITAVAAT